MWLTCRSKKSQNQEVARCAKSRVRENVADLETKPLGQAVMAKHCFALGYVNMAGENGQCKVQGVVMFWDHGSIQTFVTGVTTVSTQNTAGDHVKESAQRISSRHGNNSNSKWTSSRRPTEMLCLCTTAKSSVAWN